MKRLVIITIITACTAAYAAGALFYQFPDATTLNDNGRILIFNGNSSGVQNITGRKLRDEINAFVHLSSSRRVGSASQMFAYFSSANATKLVKRSAVNASQYARQMEVKDGSGIVQWYVQAGGKMVIGTPKPLSVSSVYPVNGATSVSNGTWFNYSSTTGGYNYWRRINTTIPTISFNKGDRPTAAIAPTGGSVGDHSAATSIFMNFSGIPNTLYTMSFNRTTYEQTDGETASSCGSAMTDSGGICSSTFRMKP